MSRRTHPAAIRYAILQETLGNGEDLVYDHDHRLSFQSLEKSYLGTFCKGKQKIHYWWITKDEELLTIDEGPGGVVVSGNIENPLERIPKRCMSLDDLENAGKFELPVVMKRDISELSKMGASVILPLEYRACDVLLPILGIVIEPESDSESVDYSVDSGFVQFYRKH
jgi:hypothetical protein